MNKLFLLPKNITGDMLIDLLKFFSFFNILSSLREYLFRDYLFYLFVHKQKE